MAEIYGSYSIDSYVVILSLFHPGICVICMTYKFVGIRISDKYGYMVIKRRMIREIVGDAYSNSNFESSVQTWARKMRKLICFYSTKMVHLLSISIQGVQQKNISKAAREYIHEVLTLLQNIVSGMALCI